MLASVECLSVLNFLEIFSQKLLMWDIFYRFLVGQSRLTRVVLLFINLLVVFISLSLQVLLPGLGYQSSWNRIKHINVINVNTSLWLK